MEGPPFSVSSEEVLSLYGARSNVTLLDSKEVIGGIKGKVAATERAWMIVDKKSQF